MSAVFLSCLMCCSGTSEGKWDIPDVTPPDVVPPDGGDETPPAEDEYVTVKNGRMYAPDGTELALWGVNFQTCLSWEYNNRLKKRGVPETETALKNATDKNLEEIKRLGANVIRCHLTPADFTDADGNLVETLYLKVLDYMVNGAKERGLYVTLTFINHMSNAYVPESVFNNVSRQDWVMVPDVVEKSKNYIAQLLDRKNPYTGLSYAEEPAIAYWELVNEPSFYEYDGDTDPLPASGAAVDAYKEYLSANGMQDSRESYRTYREKTAKEYVNTMYGLVREHGAVQPVIWNHNWPKYRNSNRMDIFNGVLASEIDGVSCCSYPGQSLVPSDYWANPKDLTSEDYTSWFKENGYEWMKSAEYASKVKVIYEFETFFNQSAYLYPVMALFFRSYGIQSASMWTYTMAEYAQYHAGSHFLSLTCTPSKAASFIVAKALFESTPAGTAFDYDSPNEQTGVNYAISKERNLSVFSDSDRLYYSGDITEWNPVEVSGTVKHIAGTGNSLLAEYSGSGLYFIDDEEDELHITLEPNHEWTGEPWNSLSQGQVSSLDETSTNKLSIHLDRWGDGNYSVYRINGSREEKVMDVSSLSDMDLIPGEYIVRKQ